MKAAPNYLKRSAATAVALTLVALITSRREAPVNNKEVLTSISCKNESMSELWDSRIVVGERSFGLGYININKKKTMIVGNLPMSKRIVVIYSFYPADGNPKSIVEKRVEFPTESLARVAAHAGELEVVCRGDAKWFVRVYERTADHKGKVLLESDMIAPEKKR